MSAKNSIKRLSLHGQDALVDGADLLVNNMGIATGQGQTQKSLEKKPYHAILSELYSLTAKEKLEAFHLLTLEYFSKDQPVDDRLDRFDKLMAIFAKLPPESEVYHKALSNMIGKFWDDIPRPPTVYANEMYRSADGSGNSFLYPWLGKSGGSYARTITSKKLVDHSKLPQPEVLFDKLLDRANTPQFKENPGGMNVVIFYFATMITHDLFHTDPTNILKNLATGYVDLAPIYGSNKEEQDRGRKFEKGLLLPDAFVDERLVFQLAGVAVLCVLFSRNHNYIAKMLLENNEGGRFSGPGISEKEQDELLFQTARLINNRCYVNIILTDYLRSILGVSVNSSFVMDPMVVPPAHKPNGNVTSLEFNYVYRWHSAIGQKDAESIKAVMQDYTDIVAKAKMKNSQQNVPLPASSGEAPPKKPRMIDMLIPLLKKNQPGFNEKDLELGLPILGIRRQTGNESGVNKSDPYVGKGYFRTEDLSRVLLEASLQPAGHLGANMVPTSLKTAEIVGILQARKAGVCTFNEFREYFGLKKFEKFEDINDDPKVAAAFAELYATVDDVELYPAVVAEKTKVVGTSLPYTISRAILSDAINLIRNDRFIVEFNPHVATVAGYKLAVGDPDVNYGRVMPHFLNRLLPNTIPEDSFFFREPFRVEKSFKKSLQEIPESSSSAYNLQPEKTGIYYRVVNFFTGGK